MQILFFPKKFRKKVSAATGWIVKVAGNGSIFRLEF